MRRRLSIIALLLAVDVVAFAARGSHTQAPPPIEEILAKVSARITQFYERVQRVICVERSTVQPIDFQRSPQGFLRIVDSELRVEPPAGGTDGEATVIRDVLRVNGRAPRDRDQKSRDGCTDPTPLSAEPLAFLLAANREEYRFRLAGVGKEDGRPVYLIDFASINRRSSAELIEDKAGHEDCFDWSGHVAAAGRIWVDVNRFDVLRVERRLLGPLDVKVPLKIQRRHRLDSFVVIDREDTTIRYQDVAFSDPDEVLVLPESIDILMVTRGGLQSTRRSQTYSGYRRFVGAARVVE